MHALNEVDLSIGRGEFVAIMGRSGSGKSTLLNMLGRMDRPDGGRYLLDDKEVSGMDDDA
ncbi:macrolide ABC transporter ATP-binding protein, partial [Enterococcus hirae]